MHEDKLFNALNLWVELTGVDPDGKVFSMGFTKEHSSWDIKKMHDELRESQQLDTSGVTTYLLLSSFSREYFSSRSFSVMSLLNNPDKTKLYLDKCTAFNELISDPDIIAAHDRFTDSLNTALNQYKLRSEATDRILEDKATLAMIRRDAFKSVAELSVNQFTHGKLSSSGKASWLNTIHQFWNINSMLDEAVNGPDGITLNLIRDPNDFYSYFAFGIKNGGNLFVLSDHPQHEHPLQRSMARRPDREFSERSGRHWFPYQLLKFEYDEDARTLYRNRSTDTALVPRQQRIFPVCQLADLEAAQVIWIALVFELLTEKFWKQGWQAPALSYTGEMIVAPELLADMAGKSSMPVTDYPVLNLPPLTLDDLCDADFHKTINASDGGNPNQWLLDRYGHKVTPEVINLAGNDSHQFYLPPVIKRASGASLLSDGLGSHRVIAVSNEADNQVESYRKEGRYRLTPMSSVQIGTAEQLNSDRRFTARYNFIQGINQLADAEFEKTHKVVAEWWKAALERNIENLCSMAKQDKCWVSMDRLSGGRGPKLMNLNTRQYCLMYRYDNRDEASRDSHYFADTYLTEGFDNGHLCCMNGTKASWFMFFEPQSAADLAYLAGCDVQQLPEVLRSWVKNRDYRGNALLDRIDPAAWAARDPWSKRFKGTVLLALSKRAMNHLLKGKL